MFANSEVGFLFASVVFTGVSCLFLLYLCVSNFTKLRLACLISTLCILFVGICNYCMTLGYWWDSATTYWFTFALARAVYTSILVICMLDMGRKFYGECTWNTFLFKATVLQLVSYDAVNVADAIMIYLEQSESVEVPLFLGQLILGVSVITSAFLYSFLPVLTIHMNKSSSAKRHISAQSAAVGTWYMTITGILSIAYLALYLFTFCYNDDNNGDLNPSPVESACDVILRTVITLAISLPPPASIIHAMKLKIVGRMTVNPQNPHRTTHEP